MVVLVTASGGSSTAAGGWRSELSGCCTDLPYLLSPAATQPLGVYHSRGARRTELFHSNSPNFTLSLIQRAAVPSCSSLMAAAPLVS